jgi:hypothetical protein
MLGPEQPMYLVRNRSRGEGNMNQIFLGLFNRLRNRDRHFGGLPFSNPDPPLSISNNDECTKVEALSPLHDFRHSVDEDNFIFQAQFIWINSHLTYLLFLFPSIPHQVESGHDLEAQTAFT